MKNAVYALPNNAQIREDFEWLRAEVAALGGEATIFAASSIKGLSSKWDERRMKAAGQSRSHAPAEAVAPRPAALDPKDYRAASGSRGQARGRSLFLRLADSPLRGRGSALRIRIVAREGARARCRSTCTRRAASSTKASAARSKCCARGSHWRRGAGPDRRDRARHRSEGRPVQGSLTQLQ